MFKGSESSFPLSFSWCGLYLTIGKRNKSGLSLGITSDLTASCTGVSFVVFS